MDVKLMHDLSPQQLKAGFWRGIDGFFLGTYWHLKMKNVHSFVRDVALKGGLKRAFSIPDSILYEHGSDRTIETEAKDKFRMFIRPPLVALREAVCFNPDVIQVMDLPLDDKDDENRVCEKLAINRDMVEDYHGWLVKNGFRSSSCYKDGLPRFSKFMLLGVCHGDIPDAYAEEAKFMMRMCEVVGIPVAGLLTHVKGLSKTQQYDYVFQVLEKVLDVVGNKRAVQLMGFGISDVSKISRLLKIAKKTDAVLFIESSTLVRNSVHARKVLSFNM
ncbi:MAG: hypothetical protein QHH17_06815, partial [Candidatus Bathyarchaeota archaeon]|nr:hypothetical protein [Candidatus Bathyarchaeota archaeon]